MYSLSTLLTGLLAGCGFSHCLLLEATSVNVTEVTGWLPMDSAQMIHGSIKCNPHSLPDARVPPFHHFQFVNGLVHTKRNHLGLGKPLPASLIVEEQNKEQLLLRLGLHVFTDLQHIQGRGGDGDTIVVARHSWHLGVNNQCWVGGIAAALGPHHLQGLQDGGSSIGGNPHAVLSHLSCNPGRLGVVSIFNTRYQLTAVFQCVPSYKRRLPSATLGCTKASGGKQT